MNRLQRTRRILQRTLLHALPTTLGIVIVVFFLLQLVPGDAADVLAAEAGSATAETMTMLRAQFGLDQPILSQLLSYLGNLSLGFSPARDGSDHVASAQYATADAAFTDHRYRGRDRAGRNNGGMGREMV